MNRFIQNTIHGPTICSYDRWHRPRVTMMRPISTTSCHLTMSQWHVLCCWWKNHRAIVFVFSLMARLTDSFNCFLFLCQLTAWFLFSYGRLVVDTRKLRKQLYCHFCCYHLWPQGCSLFSITGAKGNNRYYDSIWFLLISFFLLLTAGSLFVPGGC